MKLKNILIITEGDDLYNDGGLSPQEMNEIQKLIRRGAKNTDVEWVSAVQLLIKAYEELDYNIPTAGDIREWEQYQENAAYAVQMLNKYRGLDASWRTTLPSD